MIKRSGLLRLSISVMFIFLALITAGCPRHNTPTEGEGETPAEITITPDSGYVVVGQTLTLSATSTSSSDLIQWRSSNSLSAPVNLITGTVTGMAASATPVAITATGSVSGATATVQIWVVQIGVYGARAYVQQGRTLTLTPSSIPAGESFTWASSNNSVATVDANGIVSGILASPDPVTITVTEGSSGASGMVQVRVVQVSFASTELRYAEQGGVPLSLEAPVSPVAGDTFVWTSSNNSVATVDASGTVSGILASPDPVTITATGSVSGAAASLQVQVARVSFADAGLRYVKQGNTLTLPAPVSTLTGETFTWASSNESAATVDASGTVSGVLASPDPVTITATGDTSGAKATVQVRVVQVSKAGSGLQYVQQGQTLTLPAPVSTLAGETFTWASSNGAVATVDASGVVSGVLASSDPVTMTATGSTSGVKDTVEVRVVQISVTSPSAYVQHSATVSLTAVSTLEGETFTWASSNDLVAPVDANGVVTGLFAGPDPVTFTVTGNTSGATATVQMQVVQLSFTDAALRYVQQGQTLLLPDPVPTLDGETFTWTSNNNSVATVNAGVVSGVLASLEPVTITAEGSISGATASLQVKVVSLTDAGLLYVQEGLTLTLPAPAPTVSGETFAWASSNGATAIVNGSGVVTGVLASPDPVTITATGNTSGTKVTTKVRVVRVSVTSPSPYVEKDKTLSLSASSTLNGEAFAWASSNESVATVSAGGVVTGKASSPDPATSTVTITATGSTSGAKATVQVRVVQVSFADSALRYVPQGQTLALPAPVSTLAGETFAWASSNNSAATITNGVVSGILANPDPVVMTATGTTSGAKATVQVRVVRASFADQSTRYVQQGLTLALPAPVSTLAGEIFAWASSDNSVATVDANGVVSGISENANPVTITATGNTGGAKATLQVRVVSVSVTPNPSYVGVNGEIPLAATSTLAGESFVWLSSNETVATVSASGVVTGKTISPTPVTITATGSVSGAKGSATLWVTEFVVSPNPAYVGAGGTVKLFAPASPGDTLVWSSSNESVATVAQDGTVTGVSISDTPVTITVTKEGTSTETSGTVRVVRVKIDYSNRPLVLGVFGRSSEQLTATSTFPGDTGFTWTSDNEAVATVSETGTVIAVAEGSATISATGNVSGVTDSVKMGVFPIDPCVRIWDGEEATNTFSYGSLNRDQAYRGAGCFQGKPDAWHDASITLGAARLLDISAYDEIWLFAKVNGTGQPIRFGITGSSGTSAQVATSPLSTAYQLVKIPTANLTPTNSLTAITRLNLTFDPASSANGVKTFNVDDVWAVKLNSFAADSMPLLGPLQAVDFGDVAVDGSAVRQVTIANIGTGTLSVKQISITGKNAQEFHVSPEPFSIEPGSTHDVAVTFSPQMVLSKAIGDKSAALVLAHDLTPMGSTTSTPLSGRAVSSGIAFSRESITFGSVPVGITATQVLTISNTGNMPLTVSSINSGNVSFQATPASFVVGVGSSQAIEVGFNPSSASSVSDTLTVLSDAIGSNSALIPLSGTGVSSGSQSSFSIETGAVTASSIQLSWPTFSSAVSTKIYLGPEPSATRGQPLPTQELMNTYAAGVSSGMLEGLAPAVDCFLHLEALNAGGQVVAQGNTHVRTLGGPGAPLDPAVCVQEAHMYAPDVLQVIVVNRMVHSGIAGSDNADWGIDGVVGNTGTELQQPAQWQVTRQDGAPIVVSAIHRMSSPVGPSISAPGLSGVRVELFDVEHELFFMLAEPVGSPEILEVAGPVLTPNVVNPSTHVIETGTTFQPHFILPFSDKYLETSVIKVNQVGYAPRSTARYAYISGWMGDGGGLALSGFPATGNVLVDTEDMEIPRETAVADLPIDERLVMVPGEGEEGEVLGIESDVGSEVREIDLSGVPAAEGTVYRVQVPGVGVSWPTQVSETAVFKAFYTVLRGLTYNRWGRDLTPDWTEWSPRPQDHPTVFTSEATNWPAERGAFTSATPKIGERFLQGGHHDAGDYDIRPQHYTVAMFLLRAYEIQPDHFLDGQLNIPESGNGIPDLLDEALWSIAAWEQLQEADGSVRAGAESYSHPAWIDFADRDVLPYWTFGREPYHTMRVAGVFAHAARLLAPFDPVKADELASRAAAAYDYATAHGVGTATVGPPMYASSELYGYTGDPLYAAVFESIWNARITWRGLPNLYTVPPEGGTYQQTNNLTEQLDYVFGYFEGPNPVSSYSQNLENYVTTFANYQVSDVANRHAFRNGRNVVPIDAGYDSTAGRWLLAVYARLGMGTLTQAQLGPYYTAVSLSADYVLGCNPAGRVWITGLGSRSPLHNLHFESQMFQWLGMKPIPGIPVYGVINRVNNITTNLFANNLCYPPLAGQASLEGRPRLLRWIDVSTWASTNEFTIWENSAPQAELFSMLIAPGVMPPASWLPGGAEHQNTLAPRESADGLP